MATFFLLSLLLGAVPAGAEDLRPAVERLLSGYEPADPGPALRRLGPAAADALLALARDRSVMPIRRLRAIEALGHVPTPAGQVYLLQLVERQRGTRDSLAIFEVAAAARALGAFGPAALPALLSVADHRSADVREGVVASLGRLGTQEASAILRRRQAVEKDSGVRAVLRDAMTAQPTR